MSTCNQTIDSYQSEDGKLEVSEKYTQLMQDSISEDSLYMRTKDTFKVIFDELQITESEKAQLVAQNMATMATQLSAAAMQTALAWETSERDGAYSLAKIKADTEVALAQKELVAEQICQAQKDTELKCAQVTATISSSFRENGVPTGYEADGCRPTGLDDTGLKYHQTKQVEGATYQVYADAFRKSGVVQIGTDINDSQIKGLSGDDDGYTNQQSKNAERQRAAYNDSMANHAANSAATMIGQLLSSETLSSSNEQDIARWRTSIDYLNSPYTNVNPNP